MSWTFNLVQDAEWSDGEPLTAADVKYTLDTQYAGDYSGGGDSKEFVDTVTVVDDNTVKITVTEYASAFLDFLNSMYIVPKHIWEDVADIDTEANLAPVGSGPWLWDEYVPQSHVAFKKNPNYWGGTVNIDEMVLEIYGSQELALLALKTGQVDMVPTVELYSYIPQLLESTDVKVGVDRAANFYNFLFVDHREEPNNLPAFRQAVSMAINRQDIIDFALFTYGSIPRMVPLVPEAIASEDVDWPGLGMTDEARIDEANAMLDADSDFSDFVEGETRTYKGDPLNIEMTIVNRPADVQQAEIIRENMAEIGINVSLKLIGFGPMMGMMFGGGWDDWTWSTAGHGAGGSTLDGLAQEFGADPYNVWYDAPSLGWGEDGDGGGTTAARALQADLRQSRREDDPATLATLIEQIQVDFAAELPIIPLSQGNTIYAYRLDTFTGWAPQEEMDGQGSSGHLLGTINILALEPIAQ